MSSGIFEYTTEEKAGLFAQFGSAMKIAHDQQRPAARVSEVLNLGIIQGTHDVQMVPRIIQTPTGNVYHITSDGKVRSAAAAINALDCPVKWGLAETPAKIPMIIQPVDCNARLVTLGKTTTTEEIYNLYPKIVTPGELFAFGAKFLNEQLEGPIFTVWLDASGQFFFALLFVRGGKRVVDVCGYHPDDEFGGHCRVLVRE